MKLTRGEFCQFNLTTRFKLLTEFGQHVMKKKVRMKMISIYKVFDFYVEVYENIASRQLEKVEPVKNTNILEVYEGL
ncbi:MAG: hypothetical protein Q8941_18535 [Bacteroidota bacterium]|nr:hypothetical protein [Bacteroidota bacterium]